MVTSRFLSRIVAVALAALLCCGALSAQSAPGSAQGAASSGQAAAAAGASSASAATAAPAPAASPNTAPTAPSSAQSNPPAGQPDAKTVPVPASETVAGTQNQGAPGGDGTAIPDNPADKTFYFKLDDKGNPIFTQVIRWDADPNALEYRLILKDAADKTLVDQRQNEAFKEVHLQPGRYSYQIITFDLLGKAEASTEWISLDIIKAEQPTIASISPTAIFMDDLDGRITLIGSKLLDSGKVVIKPVNGGSEKVGKVVSRSGDSQITVLFPDSAYRSGTYTISFENPGGLSTDSQDKLLIRFQRPVDLAVSLGYAPYIPVADSWFTSIWNQGFVPLGADAAADVYFIKEGWGFMGLEARADARILKGGQSNAVVTADYLLYGLDAIYAYRITRTMRALVRLGGGVSWSYYSFNYSGFAGPTTTSNDPYMTGGLAFQYYLPFNMYGEIGADWDCVFMENHQVQGITPKLAVGYQFF